MTTDKREAALLEEVYRAPDDDAPRLVLADYLDERGAPLGELLRYQLGSKVLQRRSLVRQRGLVRQHYAAMWPGHPIHHFGRPSLEQIERGFPFVVQLSRYAARERGALLRDWQRITTLPGWSTIRELHAHGWGAAGSGELTQLLRGAGRHIQALAIDLTDLSAAEACTREGLLRRLRVKGAERCADVLAELSASPLVGGLERVSVAGNGPLFEGVFEILRDFPGLARVMTIDLESEGREVTLEREGSGWHVHHKRGWAVDARARSQLAAAARQPIAFIDSDEREERAEIDALDHDLYIAANEHDGGVARAVADGLERRGLKSWIAWRDRPPFLGESRPWTPAIDRASAVLLPYVDSKNPDQRVADREEEHAQRRGLPVFRWRGVFDARAVDADRLDRLASSIREAAATQQQVRIRHVSTHRQRPTSRALLDDAVARASEAFRGRVLFEIVESFGAAWDEDDVIAAFFSPRVTALQRDRAEIEKLGSESLACSVRHNVLVCFVEPARDPETARAELHEEQDHAEAFELATHHNRQKLIPAERDAMSTAGLAAGLELCVESALYRGFRLARR
ncbi:MAG: TIGR02996 domain-containing protein [Polyangiaceae bacterium]